MYTSDVNKLKYAGLPNGQETSKSQEKLRKMTKVR